MYAVVRRYRFDPNNSEERRVRDAFVHLLRKTPGFEAYYWLDTGEGERASLSVFPGYCRRGQAENHVKAWKTHLAADRTSCPTATANQFRLFLHAGAHWLLWSLRTLMPRASSWRVAQFDTLRLRLIKVAARIVEMKTRIKVHLPTSAPDQSILHLVLGRVAVGRRPALEDAREVVLEGGRRLANRAEDGVVGEELARVTQEVGDAPTGGVDAVRFADPA